MTKLLEQALEAARRMPPAAQDSIAQMVLDITDEAEPEDVPAEHLPAVIEGLEQADRGEFASDEEIAEALARFRR